MPGSSQQKAATHASNDMTSDTMAKTSYGSPQDGFGDGGWWSGKIHGDKDISETPRNEGKKTSVIKPNYHCNAMYYTETEYNPEVKIEDVKEEIPEIGYKIFICNCEQYFTYPNELRKDLSNESYYSRISSLKRKHMDMDQDHGHVMKEMYAELCKE